MNFTPSFPALESVLLKEFKASNGDYLWYLEGEHLAELLVSQAGGDELTHRDLTVRVLQCLQIVEIVILRKQIPNVVFVWNKTGF